MKMDNIWILAQADGGVTSERVGEEESATTTVPSDPNAGAPGPVKSKGSPFVQLLPIVLIFILMYLFLFRGPQKKQQQKQKQMMQSLGKNDKVQTIGGIIGTVVDIKENEVTLKIDESNNTKIRILASAIGRNISKEKK